MLKPFLGPKQRKIQDKSIQADADSIKDKAP